MILLSSSLNKREMIMLYANKIFATTLFFSQVLVHLYLLLMFATYDLFWQVS